MDILFAVPDLQRIDALSGEAFVGFVFEDERPLRGPLGLVDWRLCGRISRWLVDERIVGSRGERTLIPLRHRIPYDKLFVLGLGLRAQFDEHVFAHSVEDLLRTLGGARVRTCTCALPGRSLNLISPARAAELFLRAAREHGDLDEVTIVDVAEAQRPMAQEVAKDRRRARARSPS